MTTKVSIAALALVLFVSPVAASAASLSQISCPVRSADLAQCVEKAIIVTYEQPAPIGQVAYAPAQCSYFIVHTEDGDDFILARDTDKKDSAKRGNYIYANQSNDGIDFRIGSRELDLGPIDLKTTIVSVGLTASEAAAAYVAKCK